MRSIALHTMRRLTMRSKRRGGWPTGRGFPKADSSACSGRQRSGLASFFPRPGRISEAPAPFRSWRSRSWPESCGRPLRPRVPTRAREAVPQTTPESRVRAIRRQADDPQRAGAADRRAVGAAGRNGNDSFRGADAQESVTILTISKSIFCPASASSGIGTSPRLSRGKPFSTPRSGLVAGNLVRAGYRELPERAHQLVHLPIGRRLRATCLNHEVRTPRFFVRGHLGRDPLQRFLF